MRSYFLFSILAFFLTPQVSLSQPFVYEYGLSEFVLKNASPLIEQIKNQQGLGYDSLKKRILLSGCSPDVLSTPELLDDKKAFVFHSKLMKYLSDCSLERKYENLSSILKGKSVYLVISGESLKSPMSYFGHSSLLFLDENDFYFSPVVSVLAPTENLSAFEQFGKGAFDAIKAEVKIVPLHKIIDSYNNKESRKLTFIPLSSSIFDYGKIIEYFEVKAQSDLKYNFFMNNCSTYIYEALAYSCECMVDSPTIVTPLLLERNLVSLDHHQYFDLNSLYFEFNRSYEALNTEEKQKVKDMVLNVDAEYPRDAIKLGDASVKASRLSFESYGTPFSSYEKILNTYGKDNSILSEFPVLNDLDERESDDLYISSVKFWFYDDFLRIKASAVDFSHFEQRGENYLSSKLNIGSFELSGEHDDMELESLNIFDIEAITPINFVTRTPSWRFRIGADRVNDHFKPIISAGLGGAFLYSSFMFYIMPSVELSDDFEFTVYSGLTFNSDIFSVKYELKDSDESTFSLFRRENEAFGYGFSFHEGNEAKSKYDINLSFYF